MDTQPSTHASNMLTRGTFQLAAVLVMMAVVYAPTGASLARMWWVSDDYSHGFLVPLISFYLIWHKRKSLEALAPAPNMPLGVLAIIFAGFMLMAGKTGGGVLLEELSLIAMIFALVLFFWGAGFLRAVFLPLLYLVFMVKIFAESSDWFHWPFQLIAAKIGIQLLQLSGIPVYREAQFIQLPNITLEVASACSGVRFLISIIAIGIPLALLTQRRWSRRVLLVFFGILVAILANGIRVALIGFWAYSGGTVVHGPLHVFQGVFVAWAGFIALFAFAWFMRERTEAAPREQDFRGELKLFFQSVFLRPFAGHRHGPRWVAAVALLAALAAFYHFYDIKPRKIDQSLAGFPMNFSSWRAVDISPADEYFRAQGADSEVIRRYTDDTGRVVYMYVGHFEKQHSDRKLVGYQTSWKFHRNEAKMEVILQDSGVYEVNTVVLKDHGESRAVIFWYDLDGRVIADRYKAKALTAWNAMFSGRSDGTLVVISAPVTSPSELPEITRTTAGFAKDVLTMRNMMRKTP